MLSPTTTESSTTISTRRKKPNIVPRLSVRSTASNKSSEPTKYKGIPTVIHNAIRSSKTRTRLMNTRIVPIATFFTISTSRSNMGLALSFQIVTLAPSGGL